ncbi:uncharacterized protein BDZ99DRAFT_500758 [Mytilinidion resinicola]|uniref:NADH-ubiquinone oxidoreductase 17.8 kDa subunit n=1 Tax=Mytilinidion resinicola TaxID=574789 RepID=A0A6A6YCX1_9PEZI|nr:uncharacterized protein BDZ99DRAFT_500758 [Mytilinidion resinicola]KAF2806662.1 hypothetical protein BDZ99DRAFT_500758 [Mytilinidion resinicola]
MDSIALLRHLVLSTRVGKRSFIIFMERGDVLGQNQRDYDERNLANRCGPQPATMSHRETFRSVFHSAGEEVRMEGRAMLSLRRTALASARTARAAVPRLRRSAHHDAHHDAHHGPVNELFGPKFYIGVAAIPALLGLYYVSRSSDGDRPFLYRYIDSYSEYKAFWAEQNDIHVKALERAGADRNLFIHSKGQQTVDLKFPDIFNRIFNVGSPYNVPAGSSVNLDKLIAKYEKESYEAQEAKLQALKDGTLPVEREDK